ncbi:MAG: hypothetical protein AABX71_03030 [Nanoarchaeota archaeon]
MNKKKARMLMHSKTAGERILSIWMFIIWIIIFLGITSAVLAIYSVRVNVKRVEAGILSDKIIDCISENGYLREDFSYDFDVFSECRINKDVIERAGNYNILAEVYDFYSCSKKEGGFACEKKLYEVEATEQASSLYVLCIAEKTEIGCIEKAVYLLDRKDKSKAYYIKISTASDYEGE